MLLPGHLLRVRAVAACPLSSAGQREKAAPPNGGERRQHRAKKKGKSSTQRTRRPSSTNHKEWESGNTTEERRGISTTRKNPPDDPTTRCGKNRITKSTFRKQCDKAKLDPCSMMPLFERQQPIQVAMSGLLGELVVVCVMNVFCCFCRLIAVRGSWMIQHGCQ